MKQQINIRASALTIQQLELLEIVTGMSRTELISVAIDRMARENGMNTVKLYSTAKARVERSEKLAPHADFILADWPEGDEHWQWVITASDAEILSWVAAGKR